MRSVRSYFDTRCSYLLGFPLEIRQEWSRVANWTCWQGTCCTSYVSCESSETKCWRQKPHMTNLRPLALVLASATSVLLCSGCISTTREIQEPTPVVQVTPPPVQTVYSSTPPSSTNVTTTSWANGAVVQKQTTTSDSTGVVRKLTATTWNAGDDTPAQTTVTTTVAQ